MMKLIDCLPFCKPFWIARFGDWVYLFDHPHGILLGKPIFAPLASTRTDQQEQAPHAE